MSCRIVRWSCPPTTSSTHAHIAAATFLPLNTCEPHRHIHIHTHTQHTILSCSLLCLSWPPQLLPTLLHKSSSLILVIIWAGAQKSLKKSESANPQCLTLRLRDPGMGRGNQFVWAVFEPFWGVGLLVLLPCGIITDNRDVCVSVCVCVFLSLLRLIKLVVLHHHDGHNHCQDSLQSSQTPPCSGLNGLKFNLYGHGILSELFWVWW